MFALVVEIRKLFCLLASSFIDFKSLDRIIFWHIKILHHIRDTSMQLMFRRRTYKYMEKASHRTISTRLMMPSLIEQYILKLSFKT